MKKKKRIQKKRKIQMLEYPQKSQRNRSSRLAGYTQRISYHICLAGYTQHISYHICDIYRLLMD